jgi:competence protein ComEA
MNARQRVLFAAVMLLFIALAGAAAPQKKHPPATPFDLNTATAEQLQQVPGIGPTLAKRIVNLRQKSGPLHRVEDLLAIPRVTRATIAKIRPYVKVEQKK